MMSRRGRIAHKRTLSAFENVPSYEVTVSGVRQGIRVRALLDWDWGLGCDEAQFEAATHPTRGTPVGALLFPDARLYSTADSRRRACLGIIVHVESTPEGCRIREEATGPAATME